jgi:predicted ATP-grasp superfamily ATP-dependent carboligase
MFQYRGRLFVFRLSEIPALLASEDNFYAGPRVDPVMAPEFLSFDDLRAAVADRSFDRPPALVANAHVTGLGVARALATHDVPVIALDRSGRGVAPYSDAVALAGRVTYPLDDLDGFRADVESLAAEVGHEPVAFGCMDEWVHGLADAEPDGVRLPFADRDVIDAVLDKDALYAAADRLGVPYPETHRLPETDPDDAADALGFPLVVKPARKREFEEAVGTNVIEVADRDEYHEVLDAAATAGVRVMAQEKVPVERGADCSLASYVPRDGDPLAVVGNAAVRYPLGYGTSCVVQTTDRPEIRERALAVIQDAGYHGISESEFVYDRDRGEYVLLDINTRPWKWIGLPVATGRNLPMAAYADATDATDADYTPGDTHDATWVYLADYLRALHGDAPDVLDDDHWRALIDGSFQNRSDLTTGVYRPTDPDPAHRLIQTELGTDQSYYCAC